MATISHFFNKVQFKNRVETGTILPTPQSSITSKIYDKIAKQILLIFMCCNSVFCRNVVHSTQPSYNVNSFDYYCFRAYTSSIKCYSTPLSTDVYRKFGFIIHHGLDISINECMRTINNIYSYIFYGNTFPLPLQSVDSKYLNAVGESLRYSLRKKNLIGLVCICWLVYVNIHFWIIVTH